MTKAKELLKTNEGMSDDFDFRIDDLGNVSLRFQIRESVVDNDVWTVFKGLPSENYKGYTEEFYQFTKDLNQKGQIEALELTQALTALQESVVLKYGNLLKGKLEELKQNYL